MLHRLPDQRIYKYELPVQDEVTVKMPRGAKVLCVQMQNNKPHLWARVDPNREMIDHKFFVIGTGHDMPADAIVYIGTFQMMDGALVFHVYGE